MKTETHFENMDYWNMVYYIIRDFPKIRTYNHEQLMIASGIHTEYMKKLFVIENKNAIIYLWECINNLVPIIDEITQSKFTEKGENQFLELEGSLRFVMYEYYLILLYYNPEELRTQKLNGFFKEYSIAEFISDHTNIEPGLNISDDYSFMKKRSSEGFLQWKVENNYPEKFFALTDLILLAAGSSKANYLIDRKSAKALTEYGSNRYKTNAGFYQAMTEIDINNLTAFIRSNPKYQNKWKNVVLDICNNDVQVVSWLKKQPN